MVTSFEIEAYYKACEVSDIDLHIEFLRGKLDEIYNTHWGVIDKDKNVVAITAKIGHLRTKKDRLKSKIKQLRA
jgi:hypothetical protein